MWRRVIEWEDLAQCYLRRPVKVYHTRAVSRSKGHQKKKLTLALDRRPKISRQGPVILGR